MKIDFRVNFRTRPGQSMWLKLAMVFEQTDLRVGHVLPLHWMNDRQWRTVLEVGGGGPMRLEYSYQFRSDAHGVELDEWDDPRVAAVDPTMFDVLVLEDTWCSAGTVDYAFETRAFTAVLPVRWPAEKRPGPAAANHTVQLKMAAVPVGLVPCLIGSVSEIGDWDWGHAVPLDEVAPDVWQADVYLPADWWIEYKFGLYDRALGRAVRLEAGENRILQPHESGARQWTMIHDEGYRREAADLYHGAGVAIPVFSLRSNHGLGVGEFADLKFLGNWAAATGVRMIQILPVNDTTSTHDWLDSYPYSAISVHALHPLYLRIQDLGYAMPAEFEARLASARERLNAMDAVDYTEVMATKYRLTREVFDAHGAMITGLEAFHQFVAANREWLAPYAVFCVKRDFHGTADFTQWGEWAVFRREAVDAMIQPQHPEWLRCAYYLWLQYELDRQLSDAVEHLHRAGLALKGDLPIGINRHSVDAWSAPRLFHMDAQAGAPPDAFAVKGQNWGFPTYHWEVMREDGYAWWRSRFAQLSRYFDAYRIDHVLGFFRIWQVPRDQVEGIMGWFDPALPVDRDELIERGIRFDHDRYCRPYIHEDFLWERFGELAGEAVRDYLEPSGGGFYQLRDGVATQRRIVEHFEAVRTGNPAVEWRVGRLRQGLMDCASDVLLFEVPGSGGTEFHPRCLLQTTRSFQQLDPDTQRRLDELYYDYFYRKQDAFWEARGYEKLPVMRRASGMLLCGEDLGMVPGCVPGVLRELGILSLEIQRMPKRVDQMFADPADAPYLSVVSPGTHDMSTLRGWWREDAGVSARFAWEVLGEASAPADLTPELAARIIVQHLESPAMWAVFPLQDLLGMDAGLRHPDPVAERINVPSVRHHPWRYRMHLTLEELAAAAEFNARVAGMLRAAGRSGAAAPGC